MSSLPDIEKLETGARELELVCPTRKMRLQKADAGMRSEILSFAGEVTASEFLMSEDGLTAYPVENGIPRMLPESSISLEGLNTGKPVD